MTVDPALAVRHAIDAMSGTLLLAEGLCQGGRRLDLQGLDGEIVALCAAAVALGPAEGRSVRPAMEALLATLDRLTAALRAAD